MENRSLGGGNFGYWLLGAGNFGYWLLGGGNFGYYCFRYFLVTAPSHIASETKVRSQQKAKQALLGRLSEEDKLTLRDMPFWNEITYVDLPKTCLHKLDFKIPRVNGEACQKIAEHVFVHSFSELQSLVLLDTTIPTSSQFEICEETVTVVNAPAHQARNSFRANISPVRTVTWGFLSDLVYILKFQACV